MFITKGQVHYSKNNGANFTQLEKITFPTDLDPSQFFLYTMPKKMPWTMVSFNLYNTIELWWLLCILNNIKNPVIQPKAGTRIKAIRSPLVASVINDIKSQLI
jgi:hypothetical protein